MPTFDEVLVPRRSIWILNARTGHCTPSQDFYKQLSAYLGIETAIVDKQGGILTDHYHIYQLAENPLIDLDQLDKDLNNAQ